ncbi:NADH dehydrogenase [ubiquinone] 1 alpha subcomplex assembly factor 2-like [Saccoglossus kowalevskii]|uniref:Mimitin, mitochondrial-like n=1 Tax=Saccoglossus kowalevskii TaxID=10224 RepID=A0ABM0GN73_SACKO|nr:PREDICTED: mimitin, mitochondrial-like [Saccoglossus kowalevskii]
MNFLRSLFGSGRAAKYVKQFVGSDHLGNKYYEIQSRTTAFGGQRKARRLVELSTKFHEYEPDSIPIEWDSWIRRKRDNPPTMEEVFGREKNTEIRKTRAMEVDQRDKELQQKAREEGLIADSAHTIPKGHASAKVYQNIDKSSDATTTGSEFQPGAWEPPGKK